MTFTFLKLILCILIIFVAGIRVAKYGDVIAEKTGLGGVWIGIFLVALATSLPEMFIGIGSVLFVNAPDLTVGNLLGANTYNILNIVILDFLNKGTPILNGISSGQLLTGILSLIPLSIVVLGIIFTHHNLFDVSFFGVSIFSMAILLSYLFLIKIVFNFEQAKDIKAIEELKKEEKVVSKYKDITLNKAFLIYLISAIAIIFAGILLSYVGDELATIWKIEKSFVGSLLLGLITTLPEVTVSISALRLGAKELAVANMLGSNLFNMVIIFISDLFYKGSSIFHAVSISHVLTAAIVILMTVVFCSAIILKPKKKFIFNLSGYSIWFIIIFVIGFYLSIKY